MALFVGCPVFNGRAAIQFDVFVGYGSGGVNDGIVREGAWFPVGCEIHNDGPGFEAVFEFIARHAAGDNARRMRFELPTGTRKRFFFPVFAGASRYASWDARLYDSQGKRVAERTEMRCTDVNWETPLLAGLPRSFGGLPVLPRSSSPRPEAQPQVARLSAGQFPDTPIALEGLSALYLNSEGALELRPPQTAALLAWMHGGGHLVLAVEQAQDVNATKWLKDLLECEVGALVTNQSRGSMHSWLQSGATIRAEDYPDVPGATGPTRGFSPGQQPVGPRPAGNPYSLLSLDRDFEEASFAAFECPVPGAQALASVGGLPLVMNAPRGRGQLTVLAFSPEREPFRSWKNRAWFWARVLKLPGEVFDNAANIYGGISMDSVIGAMIETRQVKKLPVEWLLALLLVYLVIIGPLDYWWLKRINRQMLTWLTFPAYVGIFSVLIYYLGFRLRAGETEWSEFQLVDVLPRQSKADLRGRTYASLYSSANARYQLGSDQAFATMRGEFAGLWSGGAQDKRTSVELRDKGFQAEVSVPVWTSALYVSDWEQTSPAPLAAEAAFENGKLRLSVTNHLPRTLPEAYVACQGRLFFLGQLPPSQTKTFTLEIERGQPLLEVARSASQRFQQGVSSRKQVFGRSQQWRIELTPENAVAASFISQAGLYRGNQRSFVFPPGFELSPVMARGNAVLLAWDARHTVAGGSLRRFNPPKISQSSLLRLAIPVAAPGA